MRFLGKPLVYCGTLGTIPVEVGGRPSERKEIEVGDWVVMCGGRIGKDGIHGATLLRRSCARSRQRRPFRLAIHSLNGSCMSLFSKPIWASSVVLPIMERGASPVRLVRWASIRVDVSVNSRAHRLKYEGLQPWEVLVSEAQERMTLAVQPEQRAAFEALAKQRDVEVAFMGTFNDSGYFTVKQEGVVVASLDMNFLYEDGCPTLICRRYGKRLRSKLRAFRKRQILAR